MNFFIAIDGGGSKVHLLLFDQDYNKVDFEVTTSSNPNLTSVDEIKKNYFRAFSNMLGDKDITEIHTLFACTLVDIELPLEQLRKFVTVQNVQQMNEGNMGLYANCIPQNGVVALSGTGSDIFFLQDQQCIQAIGGWGAIVADEGSGYYIGKEALVAAIHCFEERGEETALMSMISDYLCPGDFRRSVFTMYESSAPVRAVASLSRVVDRASRAGDEVAMRILRRSGELLAQQVFTMYRWHPDSKQYPVMVTGGSWKNHLLFKVFRDCILREYPQAVVLKPKFEPIIGAVFFAMIQNGIAPEDAPALLMQKYSDFAYPIVEE